MHERRGISTHNRDYTLTSWHEERGDIYSLLHNATTIGAVVENKASQLARVYKLLYGAAHLVVATLDKVAMRYVAYAIAEQARIVDTRNRYPLAA